MNSHQENCCRVEPQAAFQRKSTAVCKQTKLSTATATPGQTFILSHLNHLHLSLKKKKTKTQFYDLPEESVTPHFKRRWSKWLKSWWLYKRKERKDNIKLQRDKNGIKTLVIRAKLSDPDTKRQLTVHDSSPLTSYSNFRVDHHTHSSARHSSER